MVVGDGGGDIERDGDMVSVVEDGDGLVEVPVIFCSSFAVVVTIIIILFISRFKFRFSTFIFFDFRTFGSFPSLVFC